MPPPPAPKKRKAAETDLASMIVPVPPPCKAAVHSVAQSAPAAAAAAVVPPVRKGRKAAAASAPAPAPAPASAPLVAPIAAPSPCNQRVSSRAKPAVNYSEDAEHIIASAPEPGPIKGARPKGTGGGGDSNSCQVTREIPQVCSTPLMTWWDKAGWGAGGGHAGDPSGSLGHVWGTDRMGLTAGQAPVRPTPTPVHPATSIPSLPPHFPPAAQPGAAAVINAGRAAVRPAPSCSSRTLLSAPNPPVHPAPSTPTILFLPLPTSPPCSPARSRSDPHRRASSRSPTSRRSDRTSPRQRCSD